MATATMQLEIDVATNFLLSFAYSKIPRSHADAFKRELTRTLLSLYSGHWYPNNPSRGSGYRCLSVSETVDPSIRSAAQSSGIDLARLREHLPKNMTMWIDPYEVSYRIGERGDITTLWEQQKQQPSTRDRNWNMESSQHYRSTQQRGRNVRSSRFQPRWVQSIDQENDLYTRSPGRSSPPSWSQWSSGEMHSEALPTGTYQHVSYGSRSSSPTYSLSSPSSSSDDDSDSQEPFFVTYRGEVYNAKALRSGYMAPSRSFALNENYYSSPRREIAVSA